MFYSLPYLLLVSSFFILTVLEYKTKEEVVRNRIRGFCAIIFIFFFGLRGYIGSDWINYERWFNEITAQHWLLRNVEPGFSFLGLFCKFIGFEYSWFQFFIVSLQVFLFDKFMSRYSKNISLSYVFLVALFPIAIIDLLRNFLAILIVMNGIPYLLNGSRVRFYLFVVAGMLFHLSTIVFFILPLFQRKHFGKNMLLLFFLIGLIVYFFRIDFYSGILNFIGQTLGGGIQSLTDQATSGAEVEYGINIGIIEKIIMFCTIMVFYKNFKDISPLILNCCIIYLMIYFYFSTSQSFINRFSNLFLWGYILVYIHLFSMIARYRSSLMYYCYIVGFIFARVFLSYNDLIYKYSNRLFSEDNLMERIDNRSNHYDGI